MKKILLFLIFSLITSFLSGANYLDLIPNHLVDSEGKKISKSVLENKTVGLYFSAQWCPPCRKFTPKLVKFRDQNQENFEVVFISSDQNSKAQEAYMQKYNMQWPAVRNNSKASRKIAQTFDVSSIPTLVILSPTGELITKEGRSQLNKKALSRWEAASKTKN